MFTNLINNTSAVVRNAVQSVVNATWKVIDAMPWRKIDKMLDSMLDAVTIVLDKLGSIIVAAFVVYILHGYVSYIIAIMAVSAMMNVGFDKRSR